MNIIQRQIAWGAGMSLLILAVLTASFYDVSHSRLAGSLGNGNT